MPAYTVSEPFTIKARWRPFPSKYSVDLFYFPFVYFFYFFNVAAQSEVKLN